MQQTSRIQGGSVSDHIRSAESHLAGGQPGHALSDLDLAFLAAPDDPTVRLLRGRALSLLGRAEAALGELDAAIQLDAKPSAAWLERAAVHLELSNWAAAEADCSRALDIDPGITRARRIRGISRYKLGSLAQAAADLSIAIDSEPVDPPTRYWRGLVLRDAGDNPAAIADFDAAITLNDRYTEAYVARGKAHANLGNMVEARSDWAVAAQMLHQSH